MRILFLFLTLLVLPGFGQQPGILARIPRRASFITNAPPEITMAKLWWDIGLFHPFTGNVSRNEWEKGYFGLLNQAMEPGADISKLVAEAVALLQDPYSMILESGEGVGQHFLPILWEVRGSEAWIVGGPASRLSKSFGPIRTINKIPFSTFLTRRLGSFRNEARLLALLSLVSHRETPFEVSFNDGQHELTIDSINTITQAGELWFNDRKSYGTNLCSPEACSFMTWPDIALIKQLDLRLANWIPTNFNSKLENTMVLRSGQAPRQSIYRISREHRGQYDADFDRYGNDSVFFNRILADPPPNFIKFITKTTPCVVTIPKIVIDEILAETLAGWALPPSMNVCARSTTYTVLPGLDLRLRLESWCQGLDIAKHHATHDNGYILSLKAAKALAIATVINHDHYFGFSTEADQVKIFKDSIRVGFESNDVLDFISKIGGVTKDPHGPLDAFLGYNEDSIAHISKRVIRRRYMQRIFNPNLPAKIMDDGKIRLLRTIPDGPKAGTELISLNGHLIADAIAKIAPYSASRNDHTDFILNRDMRIGNLFNPNKDNSNQNPFQIPEILRISGRPYNQMALTEFVFPSSKSNATLPSSMTTVSTDPRIVLIQAGSNTSLSDIITHVQNGKVVILDATKFPDPITGPWDSRGAWLLPKPFITPAMWEVFRTPNAPFTWGNEGPDDQWQRTRDFPSTVTIGVPTIRIPSEVSNLPGRIITVVNHLTVSRAEMQVSFLKESFPTITHVIGLPTGGVMGTMTKILLPSGLNDNRLVVYSPTASKIYFNGKNFDNASLPLDYKFTDQDINLEFQSGTDDALLSAAIRYAKRLLTSH